MGELQEQGLPENSISNSDMNRVNSNICYKSNASNNSNKGNKSNSCSNSNSSSTSNNSKDSKNAKNSKDRVRLRAAFYSMGGVPKVRGTMFWWSS